MKTFSKIDGENNQIVEFELHKSIGATGVVEIPTIYKVDFKKKEIEKNDTNNLKKIYKISKTKLENLKLRISKNLLNTSIDQKIIDEEIRKIILYNKNR